MAVFDIDGVLADVRHRLAHIERRPRDWDAFFAAASDDPLLAEGRSALDEAIAAGLDIVYLTGRPERCRSETTSWIRSHALPDAPLHMRRESDRRPARILKVEALRRLARDLDIAYLLDDDPEVALAAREAGFCVHVANWVDRPGPLSEAQERSGRT